MDRKFEFISKVPFFNHTIKKNTWLHESGRSLFNFVLYRTVNKLSNSFNNYINNNEIVNYNSHNSSSLITIDFLWMYLKYNWSVIIDNPSIM